jgi:hypothetical protein
MNIPQISGVKVLLFSAFLSLLAGITLTGCSEKDTICDCITASEKFEKEANKALASGPVKVDAKKFKKLQADKMKKCAEFQKMSGPEMLERKATCE